MVQYSNMGVGTKLCVVGVVVAAIAFCIVRKHREDFDSCDPIEKQSRKLGDLTLAAEEIEVDLKTQTIGEAINLKMSYLTNKLKNVLMTPEMQDALETIQYVLDNVKKFDMEAKDYESFTFILMALVKKAQDSSEVAAWQKNLPKTSEIESSQLEKAQRFGEYAVNVYPASWRLSMESIARQMNISENAIEFVYFKDEDDDGHCPKFILFLDHEIQSLVLAVRGTFSLKDVILDIVCDEVSFLDGFAHKGILNGANRILTKIQNKLRNSLLLNPGYSLIVTGHSLGAGTAELITLELLHGKLKSILPAQTDVSCIALAPPPVYRPADSFSNSLPASTKGAIEIYINNFDCVPRLSLGSVARLLASMRAVDSLSLTLSQQFAILADRKEEEVKQNFQRVIRSVTEARQDEFPFLQHPGRIFYLKKTSAEGKEQMVYQQESHTFSGAILLLENMLTDHLQPSYQDALQNAQARK